MTCAAEYAAIDWTPMKLTALFRETGRGPSTVLALTPGEFRYLFPMSSGESVDEPDRLMKSARGHARENEKRAARGLVPKLANELRLRIEGKL